MSTPSPRRSRPRVQRRGRTPMKSMSLVALAPRARPAGSTAQRPAGANPAAPAAAAPAPAAAAATPTPAPAPSTPTGGELIQSILEQELEAPRNGYTYQPAGRRDPFV